MKAGKTRISTSNYDTKYCALLLRRSLAGTTEFVENRNRSRFVGYSQTNQYLCACLKLLKKQRYAGQSVISTEQIKSESVCMLMKMIQSVMVKYSKSIYKEKITSSITPYWLVWEVQWIKEALWERKNKFKEFALSGIHDSMCFLMTECRIICGKLLFWCELSEFWGFMITDESPIHQNVWL